VFEIIEFGIRLVVISESVRDIYYHQAIYHCQKYIEYINSKRKTDFDMLHGRFKFCKVKFLDH